MLKRTRECDEQRAKSQGRASEHLSLSELAACWRRDLLENVVPFWLKHSVDHLHGGYFTALDCDGSLLNDNKYMWLQGRAVFMWSRLHNDLGPECGPDVSSQWFEAALCGARFLERSKDTNGLLFFSTSRDGATPLHMQRKPYSAVFYVQACLEFGDALRRRSRQGLDTAGEGASKYLREATKYFDLLRSWIDDPTLLGNVHSGGGTSILADVMCLVSGRSSNPARIRVHP